VDRLASKSSFQAETGVENSNSIMYAEPTTSLTTFSEPAVTEETELSFTIEDEDGQKTISLTIPANASIQDIVDAINADSENINEDSTYVKATAATSDTGSYVSLSSTATDTTKNNQILVSEGPGFITPDLSFSYQVGADNDPVYVTVPPGASFESVVSLINNDTNNSGMKAAMINTGIGDTPWLLSFSANHSGEDNRLSLSENIAMIEIQGSEGDGSLNAAFSIDGFDYQRQSNSGIDDVIQGVSLTLKKVDSTQVTLSPSSDTMKEKIINLIDIYNEINGEIDVKTSYTIEGEDENGILSNVQSLKSLDSTLFDLLGTTINTGTSITSLADLGMERNRDGTITLDQSILEEAFSSSFDDVAALFIGDSDTEVEGLGDILNNELRVMTSSTGVVNAEKSTAQEKINNLTESIETAMQRLDKKYDQMAKQFIQLDTYIGKMNSQANYLSSVIDSFNTTTNTN
jgi:flagellar hook-associated protein 2